MSFDKHMHRSSEWELKHIWSTNEILQTVATDALKFESILKRNLLLCKSRGIEKGMTRCLMLKVSWRHSRSFLVTQTIWCLHMRHCFATMQLVIPLYTHAQISRVIIFVSSFSWLSTLVRFQNLTTSLQLRISVKTSWIETRPLI